MDKLDSMDIAILEDGTIRIETDRISPANHQTAEAFMRYLAELTAGKTTRTRRGHHHHSHGEHEHTHDEETH